MLYRARFYAHCGMSYPIGPSDWTDDLAAVRRAVARFFRSVRHNQLVCPLPAHDDEHARWEVCEPDGCVLVPDTAGTCCIETKEEDRPYRCLYCGEDHTTIGAAEECCFSGDGADWNDPRHMKRPNV